MISNFLSNKWSSLVELAAQEISVARRITGDQYQADATGAKAIYAARVSDINIIDYTNDTNLSALQSLSDVEVEILLDQKRAFNFSVDDVDQVQSMADFRPAAMMQAARKLALEADSYVLGLYNDGSIPADNKVGSLATPVSITSANADSQLDELSEKLDVNNAGPARWVVVPSWYMNKLKDAGLGYALDFETMGGMWREGEVLRYNELNIVKSNQVAIDDTADGYQIMAFSDRAIPMVGQVNRIEALRNPNRFGDIVRGLFVFGASIVHPTEVAVLSCTKG